MLFGESAMRRSRVRRQHALSLVAAAAAASLSLVACEAGIKLDYTPTSGVAALPGASAAIAKVTAIDRRTQNRDRVSTKNGVLQSPVRAENDVVELVRHAVETELKAEGFTMSSGGAEIVVELEDFYSDYVMKLLDNAAEASVSFSLRVKDRSGAARYTHLYSGTDREKYGIAETGSLAKTALERALTQAMRQVVDDKALAQAILAAGSQSSATSTR
jgi:uncharacterized lipoprotein